ncbi:MAG TPA: hypothetical protein PKE26_00275 [Kiritimatiellia bacterium]|nr:hypothetical protein [Kiritimatiellia bacterium]HMO97530.1 hypothetical protein [Kiritimatiellia bacterium]HMP98120.1 hypothetical protein [Kiritimatiellia bacterium]
MKTFTFLGVLSCALVVVCGCATPQSRIKQNPELFASFPPEAQALIQQGQIDIGFTPEMVTMALGAPNRTYTRQTRQGILEVWSYTAKQTTTDRQRVNANFRYRDAGGSMRSGSDWVWVDVARDIEYERMRVEFTEGIVLAIESLQR